MILKINFIFWFLTLFAICPLLGQYSDCQVPHNISNGKLAVELAQNTFESGKYGMVRSYFKMPGKSNEVNNASWITCSGLMPNGAKIRSIKIESITGLPQGLKWRCDKEDCYYKGEETGCVTIEGTTNKKGIYKIEIYLKGVGSLWGIKKNTECFIKKFEIIVK